MKFNLIRVNALANYIGTAFLLIFSITTVPYLLESLGPEAYGLIGFFAILQNILSVFDLGFSQFVGRQAAIAKGRNTEFIFFADILKSVEVYAIFLLGIILLLLFPISSALTDYWFQSNILTSREIEISLRIMFVCGALQIFIRLYKFALIGFEAQVWVNSFTIIIGALRFVGALFFIWLISDEIFHFFLYQLGIIILEGAVLRLKLYSIIPSSLDLSLRFNLIALKQALPLCASLAVVSFFWILATQSDKFILSKILPLNEFGFFTLVTLISSSSIYIVLPIRQAVQPRLTALLDNLKLSEAILLYRQSSHFIALLTGAFVSFLFYYSEALIFIWTGNRELTEFSEDILYLFAAGSGLFAIQLILVALQIANGALSLHIKTTAISLVLQIPIIAWAALEYGVFGVAVSWFFLRFLFFILWPLIIHRSFSKDLHLNWLFKDVLPVVAIQIATGYVLSNIISIQFIYSSFLPVITLLLIGLVILLSGLIYSPYLRDFFKLALSAGKK